jgi:hypothetical protein
MLRYLNVMGENGGLGGREYNMHAAKGCAKCGITF